MQKSRYSIQDHNYDEDDYDSDCSFETAYTTAQPRSRLGFDREEHGKRSLYRTEQDGRQIGYDEEQGMHLKSRHHHLGFSNERLERDTHKEIVDHRERKEESGYDREQHVTGTHYSEVYNARSQNRNRPNIGSNSSDEDTEGRSYGESDVGSDFSSQRGSDLENRGTPDVRTDYRERPNGRVYSAERPARSELRSPGYSRCDPRLQGEESDVESDDGKESGLEQDIADLNLRERHNSKSNCKERPGLMSNYHSRVESGDDMDCREKRDIKLSSYRHRGGKVSGHGEELDSSPECNRRSDARPAGRERGTSDMDRRYNPKSSYRDRNDEISNHGDEFDARSDSRQAYGEKDAPHMDKREKYKKSSYRDRNDEMSGHSDDFDSRSDCSRRRDLRQDYRKDASDMDQKERHKSGYKGRNDDISRPGDNSSVRSSGGRRPDSRPDFKDDVSNIDYRGKHEKSNYRVGSNRMSDSDDFDSKSNCSRGYDERFEKEASDLGRRGKHDKKLINRERSERGSDGGDDFDSRSNCSRRCDLRQEYRKGASDMDQNEKPKSSYKDRNDNISGRRDSSDARSGGSRRSDSRPDVSNIDYRGKQEKSNYRDGSDRMSDDDDFDSRSNRSRGYDSRLERDASDLGHRRKLDKKLINRDRSERVLDNSDDFDSRSNCSRKSGSRSDHIERNVSDLDLKGKHDKKLNSRDRRDGMSNHSDDFNSRSTCSVKSDPRFEKRERGPPGIDCRGKHDMESTYRGRSDRTPDYGDDSRSSCNRRPDSRPGHIEDAEAEMGFREKCMERDGRRRHGSSDCHRGSELRSDYGSETDARLNYQRRPDSEPRFRGRGPEKGAIEAELRERHDKKPESKRPSSSSSFRGKYDKESGSRRVDAGDYWEDSKLHGKERLESHHTSLGDGERQKLTRLPPVTQSYTSERETLRSRDMDEYGPLLDSREIPGTEFENRARLGYKRPNKESDNVRYDAEEAYRYMPDPDNRTVDTGIGHMEKWNPMSNDQVRPDIESEYRLQSPNCRTSHRQGEYFDHRFERQPDNRQNVHKNKPKISEKQIIYNIIKELAKFQGQWSTVVSLSRLIQRSQSEIEQVVKKNTEIFGQMVNQTGDDVMVELCPKLCLCDNFIHFTGCRDPEKCFKMHMCKFFILETCGKGAICPYGHRWKTGHNLKVLERFHIQDVDPNILQELLKKTTQSNLVPKICLFYNGQGCKKGATECSALHICHAYVYSGQMCRDECQLNHDIFADHCIPLLKKYGISINESPRHVLQKLNPGPPQYKASRKFARPHLATSWRIPKKNLKVNLDKNTNESSTSEDSSDEPEDSKHDKRNKSGKGKKSKQKKETNVGAGENTKKGTRYCNDLCGDVVVPEICKFNLSGKCFKEDTGCLRLHSKNSFHWQVELNGSWYNLRDFQCYILETACIDANEDGVVLQYHDPRNKDTLTKALYNLLGTSDLHVDFETMTMKSQLNVSMRLRRLTSSSSTGSHLFQWFFYDDRKWIKYGGVDSHGRTDLVSSLTSDDIEQNYLKDKNQIVKFKNQQFQYEINFQNMKQKNLATNKERPIRRRPKRT